ncbi:hypothetical protein GGF32_001208 [Allomyces javanicus]|nr:hypothetical protein GGF32_001208 [Allomyces javanicus]
MRPSRASRRPRKPTLALAAVTALLLVAAVAHAVPLASPDTAAATTAAGSGYAGHQVLRVFLDKHDLASVRSALQGTDIWTDLALTSTYVDVRADAAHAAQLRTQFRTEVLIADVEAAMTASTQPAAAAADDAPAGPGRNAVDGEVVADAVVAKFGITSTYLGYDTMRAMNACTKADAHRVHRRRKATTETIVLQLRVEFVSDAAADLWACHIPPRAIRWIADSTRAM